MELVAALAQHRATGVLLEFLPGSLVAGVEAALIGMREGGYRKVRISPHLAYRASGVQGKVPPNAVLVYELWLTTIEKRGLTARPTRDAREASRLDYPSQSRAGGRGR